MPTTITAYYNFSTTLARASDLNNNFSNHRGTLLPIDSTVSSATTGTYELGSSSYAWKKYNIACGDWKVGDIKAHHSYNGLEGPGQGWMLCDGRLINQTNYDAEHGAGSWASYIDSSTLTGYYLPDLVQRYQIGVSATTQSGASSITSIGLTSHTIDLQHLHTGAAHSHAWLNNSDATKAQTYDSVGALIAFTISSSGVGTQYIRGNTGAADGSVIANNSSKIAYTEFSSALTTNYGSWTTTLTTKNIQPRSIAVQFYMRIV